MKQLFFLLCFSWATTIWGQVNVFDLYQRSGQFYQTEAYPAFISTTDTLLKQVRNPDLLLRMAVAHQQVGNSKIAIEYLQELAQLKICVDIDTFSVFTPLEGLTRFKKTSKKLRRNCEPINSSSLAFQLAEKTLIPEGLACHPSTGTFYLGSLAQHKVVQCGTDQGGSDLIQSGQDGLWSVLGMKVDPQRQELWLCSATEVDAAHEDAGLFGFHLKDGSLVQKILLPETDQAHLFNDLVITESKIYLTDSKAGKVWNWSRGDNTLQALNTQRDFVYPNGIAIDPSQRYLFVADAIGIRRINLIDQTEISLAPKLMAHLNGIDGLYFYENSLIAIQTAGQGSTRVVRFYLNKRLDSIRKMKILQTEHPEFVIPTTGTIYQGHFYYIANSHLRSLQPDGTIVGEEKLQGTKVFRIELQ